MQLCVLDATEVGDSEANNLQRTPFEAATDKVAARFDEFPVGMVVYGQLPMQQLLMNIKMLVKAFTFI
jgi:hypothetical protein